ncbi:MAG TPA: alginate lyase family protein [Verrucomicrobiae bacterium]|jgi:hypothetical protein|nr:alginate lyase family protein [Verrucomicrobiae bacterium]
MSLTEIACRGRQEASKWLERVGANGSAHSEPQDILNKLLTREALPKLPGGDSDFGAIAKRLWKRFQETAASRFFEGATEHGAATVLHGEMPETAARIIGAAERILAGRFDLLGYEKLFFGDPIDWRLDPVTGRRSILAHWSRIDPLDAAAVGDSKIVWELSRHQWMMYLGIAYRLTGEEKYARCAAEYFRQWVRANPPGLGIHWTSSLETALRIVSWSWALFLFRGSEALAPELFLRMLECVSHHAVRVEKYLSYYFAPNTHLTGEALGLFYAGVLFADLQGARRWRELGARILIDECGRQILSDGVYFEQSICYQRYTAEIYLHFLILAKRNEIALPQSVGHRIERLIDALVTLRRPDGSLPDIGDADGGCLLPFDRRNGNDARGVFAVAAAFFNRPDYAWAAEGPASESLWLLGAARHKDCRRIAPTPPAGRSCSISDGYVVMRSGWARDAHQLIFDTGPLSSPKSGHGHADLLSIQCSVFGEPYLVDAGTYCYTSEPAWRDFFRGSLAHSTVAVDGESQALSSGPFKWKDHPGARLRRWLSADDYDFADAEHYAYTRLLDPVVHRRRIVFVKQSYWIVVDDLLGSAEHRVDIRFQFAPFPVDIEDGRWVRARGHQGHALLLRHFANVPYRLELVRGGVAPIQGWHSPEYGRRVPAPVLICSMHTRLPSRVMTVVIPFADASAQPPDILPILSDPIGPSGLSFIRNGETVMIHENEVAIRRTDSMN